MFFKVKFCSRPNWRRNAACQASTAMPGACCVRDMRAAARLVGLLLLVFLFVGMCLLVTALTLRPCPARYTGTLAPSLAQTILGYKVRRCLRMPCSANARMSAGHSRQICSVADP